MQHAQIISIHQALLALGTEKLPIAYEIAKNVKMCERVMAETRELIQTIFKKYADRDDKGNLLEIVEDGKKRHQVTVPENVAQCNEELAKVEKEEHDIKFVPISSSIVIGKDIPVTTLVPLLDTIIVD